LVAFSGLEINLAGEDLLKNDQVVPVHEQIFMKPDRRRSG
jgi:hypothetical protein